MREIISFVREFWAFLRARKKFWLVPILVVIAILGGLVVFSEGTAVAPLIYTIF